MNQTFIIFFIVFAALFAGLLIGFIFGVHEGIAFAGSQAYIIQCATNYIPLNLTMG